ncbi:sigma-70 family RNA polymerase sigma factor [Lysobacter sp. CA196]|uniref:sigma-70 family RNA polymerase sigma factor n=1 Tax=Lysobacter sp. CA196 TaxID=3455606 RepID=UPI003F8D8E2B
MAIILPFVRKTLTDEAMSESSSEGASESGPELPFESQDAGDCSGRLWGRLMEQAQGGDRVAYQALLKGITPYLRSITRRYLGRGEDAEDAVQEVLMTVHAIRHTYECGRPFKPWLSTIATRRCIDLLRKRSQRLKHEIEAGDEIAERPHVAQGPDEAISRQHAAGVVQRAVAALPERQREAVRLLRLNELSLSEAAAQSDQSVGSLKVACHRALKSLRAMVMKEGAIHE